MRRVNQAAALGFIALALFVIFQARSLNYYTKLGPGPGFFPLWLGIILAGLSTVWLAQVSLRPAGHMEKGFVPDRGGIARIVSILIALVLFGALVDIIGFQLTMFAFLLSLLVALGRQNAILTVAISVLGSFGLYYLFKNHLDVQLPGSSIEILRSLGL